MSCIGRDVKPTSTVPSTAMEIDGVTPATAIISMETEITEPSTTPAAGEAHTLATLTSALTDWLTTIGGLLNSLDHHLAVVQADSINEISQKSSHDDSVNRVLLEIKGKETGSKESGLLSGSSWGASPGMGFSGKGKILGAGEEEMELDEEVEVRKERKGEKEINRKSKRARDGKGRGD